MNIISARHGGSGDAYARLIEVLRCELECADIAAIADRIFESEKAEFHWESRLQERYLGQHFTMDEDDLDLSRIAVLSFVAGRWHAGICIVDGDGCATEMLWIRSFDEHQDAQDAFARAR